MKASNPRSLKINIIWNSAGSLFYFALQWLSTVAVVYLSGYENAGLLSLAISASNLTVSISAYGMRAYQVSDNAGQFDTGTYLASRLLTCFAAMLFCTVTVLVNSYSITQALCILLYSLYRMSESLSDVLHGIDQMHARMDIIGKSFFMRSILSFSAFVLILISTENLLLAVSAMAVLSFVVIAVYDLPQTNALSPLKLCFKTKPLFKLLVVCFPLMAYLFLLNGVNSVPRFAIETLLGQKELGFYSSVSIPASLIQMSATFIFSPLLVPLTREWSQKNAKAFMRMILITLAIIAAISALALGLSAVLGEFALVLVFGQQIRSHVYLLGPVIAGACCTAFSWFLCNVLIVMRKITYLVIACSAGFAPCLFFSEAFVRRFGANGASYLICLCQIVVLLLAMVAIAFSSKKHFAKKRSL